MSDGKYHYTHKALGADMFRYSANFGRNWTQWSNWEDVTDIDANVFTDSDLWWSGDHIMVQCESFRAFLLYVEK